MQRILSSNVFANLIALLLIGLLIVIPPVALQHGWNGLMVPCWPALPTISYGRAMTFWLIVLCCLFARSPDGLALADLED